MNEEYKPLPGQLTGTQSNRVGGGEVISSASLSQQPISLAQKKIDTNPYTSLLGGTNSTIGANDGSLTSAPVEPKKETASDLMTQIQGMLAPPQASVSQGDINNAQGKVSTGEAGLNVAAQAEQNARDKYNALNAQLQQFQYNASTLIPAALQQQAEGQGITKAGLAPLQAAELRKNALAAAPVQFNALIAQAELASAQGRTALAQGVLTQASNHLDKMVELQQSDIQAKYDHQKDIFNKVWEYVNDKEKQTVEALAQQKEQAFTLERDRINNDYSEKKMLLQQQIDAQDPLRKIDMKLKEAQLAKTQRETSLLGKSTPADIKADKAALKEANASIPVMQDKIDAVDALKTNAGLKSRVGTNFLSRTSAQSGFLGSISGAIGNLIKAPLTLGLGTYGDVAASVTGQGQQFAGGVHKLVGGLTLQELIEAKARGATFGALSDSELRILANSATSINDWEIKDKDNKGIGIWNIDESSFKKELDTIKQLTQRAIIQKQGNVFNAEETSVLDSLYENEQVNPANYY